MPRKRVGGGGVGGGGEGEGGLAIHWSVGGKEGWLPTLYATERVDGRCRREPGGSTRDCRSLLSR